MPKQQLFSLKDCFVENFDWSKLYGERAGFLRFVGQKPVNAKQNWSKLKHGKPVPKEMIEEFIQYLIKKNLGAYTFDDIAEEEGSASTEKVRNLWERGWAGVMEYMRSKLSVSAASVCANDEDARMAARMVLLCVGAAHEKGARGDRAIEVAERIMKRTLNQYTDFVLKVWRANRESVLFGIHNGRKGPERVGVVISVALTADAYFRFRSGVLEDRDIQSSDILQRSPYIHVNAVADVVSDSRTMKAARSAIMTHTTIFQFSSICVAGGVFYPTAHVITLAGTPENHARINSFAFRELDNRTPETGMIIAEFAPPTWESHGAALPVAQAEYCCMLGLILGFQALTRPSSSLTNY